MTKLATVQNQKIIENLLTQPNSEIAQAAFEKLAGKIYQTAEETYKTGAICADRMMSAIINQLQEIMKNSDIFKADDQHKTKYFVNIESMIDCRINQLSRPSPTDDTPEPERMQELSICNVYMALLHMVRLAKQQAAIQALNENCVQYKSYLEEKIKKAGIKPEYNLSQSPTSKSNYTFPEQRGKNNFLVQKYNAVCDLQSTLSTSDISLEKRLTAFHKKLCDNSAISTKNTISQHRDSKSMCFLKNIVTVLTSLFLGVGLIARALHSTKQPGNSFSFWKSTGQRVADRLTEELNYALPTVNCRP